MNVSGERYRVAYPALAQIALLPTSEKRALKELFSRQDIRRAEGTTRTNSGNYVSRLGSRRVLWRMCDRTPEILSVLDRSYSAQ